MNFMKNLPYQVNPESSVCKEKTEPGFDNCLCPKGMDPEANQDFFLPEGPDEDPLPV
jgi:hypothetical protein